MRRFEEDHAPTVSAVAFANHSRLADPDLGGKPRKANRSAGKPETESAAITALGPGMGETRMPFSGQT